MTETQRNLLRKCERHGCGERYGDHVVATVPLCPAPGFVFGEQFLWPDDESPPPPPRRSASEADTHPATPSVRAAALSTSALMTIAGSVLRSSALPVDRVVGEALLLAAAKVRSAGQNAIPGTPRYNFAVEIGEVR